MAQATLDSNSRDWRARLRGDPGNWLLDAADNPSVYFWFQRDIVGRPKDSPALVEAREKILFSGAVQKILSAQNAGGYWEDSELLDAPRYRATLWSLALLAELGAPPQSRRARAACELVLQNHIQADGSWSGLNDEANAGVLVRALNYYCPLDQRIFRLYESVADDAARGNVFALWAVTEMPVEWRSARFKAAVAAGAESILNALARGDYPVLSAFPSFEPRDALLALRVLTGIGKAADARATGVIEKIWGRQGEGARWSLEKSFNGELFAEFDAAGAPSKWATLAVLRIVTKI